MKVKKRTSSEIDKTLSIQEVKSKKAGKGRELKWKKCHFKNKGINCLILLSRRGILKTKFTLPTISSTLFAIYRDCQNIFR